MARTLLLALLHLCITATVTTTNLDLPNIVFFYADDLGIGDVGCFGNTTIRTPNIDSICERGVKLSQHLAAAPVCTPSRAALMTARYPIRTGLASPNDWTMSLSLMSSIGLPPDEYTLPQMLKAKGYITGLVGKWHLGLNYQMNDRRYNPTRFGFDYFFGAPFTNIRNLDRTRESGDVFRAGTPQLDTITFVIPLILLISGYLIHTTFGSAVTILFLLVTGSSYGFVVYTFNFPHIFNSVLQRNDEIVEMPINFDRMSQRLVNEGIRFLEARQEDQKPFFLMMSWLQVHTFLHATHPFKGRSVHGAYGDEVEEMDWSTGEVMKALNQLGLNKNTIIYFSSDNGGHKEEKHPDGSQTGGWNGIYTGSKSQGGQEGGIRMPSAILWPQRFPAGSEVTEPTSQMDLMVTLAEIVGGHMPSDRFIDGKNILPLLEGKSQMSPHETLFHYCGSWLHAVRYRPREGEDVYKLHYAWPKWTPGSDECPPLACSCFTDHQALTKPKLFNVARDPREKTELNTLLPHYASIVAHIEGARLAHERTTLHAPESQMGYLNHFGNLLNHPVCDFPSAIFCQDSMNALDYKPRFG